MTVQDVSVRNAGPADAAAIAAMIRELAAYEGMAQDVGFSTPQLQRALTGDPPRLHVLVAEDADGPLGFVSYTIDFAIWTGTDVLRVDDVFVSSRARRRGVGRLLMARIAALATAAGMSARWELETKNHAAQQFYKGLGVSLRDKMVARWDLAAMRALLA
ncbi:MAG TPA: GNAT family N-acetyltransferase [Vineibacter sp.]|nr:GNAT family N-acetyltransferase [Vineibacter sp.]